MTDQNGQKPDGEHPIRCLTREDRSKWARFAMASMETGSTTDAAVREADEMLRAYQERCDPVAKEPAHDAAPTVHADPAVFGAPGLTHPPGPWHMSGSLDEVTCSGCLRLIARHALASVDLKMARSVALETIDRAERARAEAAGVPDPRTLQDVADRLQRERDTYRSQAEDLRAARDAARERAERAEKQCAHHRSVAEVRVDAVDRAKTAEAEVRRLTARAEAAEARIPADMPTSTILFRECEKGHGRLTASNWVDHGCSTCEREGLMAETCRLNALIAPEREAAAEKGREVVRLTVELRDLGLRLEAGRVDRQRAEASRRQALAEVERMGAEIRQLAAESMARRKRAEAAETEIASKDRALPGLLAEGKKLEQERALAAEVLAKTRGAILQEAVNALANWIPYRARSLEISAIIGRAAGAGFPAKEPF